MVLFQLELNYYAILYPGKTKKQMNPKVFESIFIENVCRFAGGAHSRASVNSFARVRQVIITAEARTAAISVCGRGGILGERRRTAEE